MNVKDYKQRFDAVKDTYSRAGKYENDEQVRRDLYANYISELLFKNKKDIKRLAKNNRSLVMKLYELVNRLLDAIGFKGASARLQLLEMRQLLGEALGADVRAQVSERVASTEKKSLAALYDPENVEAALALREGKIDEAQFDSVYYRCLREKDEVYGRFEVTDEIRDAYDSLREGKISFEEYEDIYNSELERGEEREYSVENVYDYTKSFKEQVDDWKAGLIPERDSLLVCKTPQILLDIGFNELPITINQTHVEYAINGKPGETDAAHHIGEALLKQFPDAFEDPVAVFHNEKHPGRVSIVLKLKHPNTGKDVFVSMEIDGDADFNKIRFNSNSIVTTFAKKNVIVRDFVKAAKEESKGNIAIFYINKKDANALKNLAGNQYPRRLLGDGIIHSIRDEGSPVKIKFDFSYTEMIYRLRDMIYGLRRMIYFRFAQI